MKALIELFSYKLSFIDDFRVIFSRYNLMNQLHELTSIFTKFSCQRLHLTKAYEIVSLKSVFFSKYFFASILSFVYCFLKMHFMKPKCI